MITTIIIGSPRNNGSSAIVADKIIEGMTQEGKYSGEINKFCLGDIDLKYCIGCKACYSNGKCVINDGFQEVFNKIIESDYIVLISPSYWGDITGHTKVFFDRSTPYCDTNPQRKYPVKNRKGISVAIRTGLNEAENKHIIETTEHYYGHLAIKPVDKLSICGVEKPSDLLAHSDALDKAYNIGVKIGQGIYQLSNSISYCGLVCQLCHLADRCDGCRSENNCCGSRNSEQGCYQYNCCQEKGIEGCWQCDIAPCDKGMFSESHDIRLRAFIKYIKENSKEKLAERLYSNMQKDIFYGHGRDYDNLGSIDAVLSKLNGD